MGFYGGMRREILGLVQSLKARGIMPFTDQPLRHIVNGDRTACARCGAVLTPDVQTKMPGDIVCSKKDGGFLGDLPWARDCVST